MVATVPVEIQFQISLTMVMFVWLVKNSNQRCCKCSEQDPNSQM